MEDGAKEIFNQLVSYNKADTIFATNTSSPSITGIQEKSPPGNACRHAFF